VLNVFRSWPPKLTSALILGSGSLHLLTRWLFGTLSGALFMSLAVYQWRWVSSESKPMSGEQLAIWLSDLPVEASVAITTAVITVVGFLVAFRTATLSWREQTLTSLRVAAAEEIQRFFDEVSRLLLALEAYARDVSMTAGTVQNQGFSKQTSWRTRKIYEDLDDFLANRARFSVLSVEVYRLGGKHYTLLGSIPGALATFKDCESAVDAVSKAMWVTAPKFDGGELDRPDQLFLQTVNPGQWEILAETCDRHYDSLSVLSSGIRSTLFKGLHEANLTVLLEIAKNRATMETALGLSNPSRPKGRENTSRR
jgi:hypothetical protein